MVYRSRRAKLWQFPSNFYQKWKRFPRYIDLNKVLAEGCHGAKLWPLPLCFQPILKLRWFHSSSLFFGIRGSNGMGQNRELSNPIFFSFSFCALSILWSPRLVPAHGPLLIQRSVMEELQREFRWQWETTSTHRFRMADDMQYSFAYTHYLLEVGQILSFGNIHH